MIKNMSKEELEILSYADLSEIILNEAHKPLNTAILFKEICKLLDYDEDEYSNKIGDFYTALSTDKRFVFLKTNEWELRVKHPVDIVLEDEDEDEEEIEEIDDYEEIEETEDVTDTIDDEDDMEDLSVLSEEELDED